MIHEDVIVYAHQDGADYVAVIGDAWVRWPAVSDGWQRRQRCAPSVVDDCDELPPALGDLALRLSGGR